MVMSFFLVLVGYIHASRLTFLHMVDYLLAFDLTLGVCRYTAVSELRLCAWGEYPQSRRYRSRDNVYYW